MTKLTTMYLTKMSYLSLFEHFFALIWIGFSWLIVYGLVLSVGVALLSYLPIPGFITALFLLVILLLLPASIATYWHRQLLNIKKSDSWIPVLDKDIVSYVGAILVLTFLMSLPALILFAIQMKVIPVGTIPYDFLHSSVFFVVYTLFYLIWWAGILSIFGFKLPAAAVEEDAWTLKMAARLSKGHRLPIFLALLISLLPGIFMTYGYGYFSTMTNKAAVSHQQHGHTEQSKKKISYVSAKKIPSNWKSVITMLPTFTFFFVNYFLLSMLTLSVITHSYKILQPKA